MYRRQTLMTGTTILAGLAGCSLNDAGPANETDTLTSTESAVADHSGFSNQPDYNDTVTIWNYGEEPHTVEVEIIHVESGDTFYSESPTVEEEAGMDLFDFSELEDEYEGVETFEIRAENSEYSDSIEFDTSVCHSGPRIAVTEDEIHVTYDMC